MTKGSSTTRGAVRAVVMRDGVAGYHETYRTSCSGCYEAGEYGGNEHLYPYDHDAGCRRGAGCGECGHRGLRLSTVWIPFDALPAPHRH